MFQILIVFGILYSYLLGALVKYVPFCLLCAVWVLLHLIGTLCIPESPYYLIIKNHPERAAASLQTLRGSSDTTEELATIKVSFPYIIIIIDVRRTSWTYFMIKL